MTKPLGESDIRGALEELLTADFAMGEIPLLSHPGLILHLERTNHTGLCVTARDVETGVERIRCMVSITARKVPSSSRVDIQTWVPPIMSDVAAPMPGALLGLTEKSVEVTFEFTPEVARQAEGILCGTGVPISELHPLDAAAVAEVRAELARRANPWREGTWGPRPILDARGRSTGLDYANTPCGGDIVLAPDGSGEEYVVVTAITAANPTNVTVRSIVDEAKTYTFPVDSSIPVQFRRAELGRAVETVAAAFPGAEVLS